MFSSLNDSESGGERSQRAPGIRRQRAQHGEYYEASIITGLAPTSGVAESGTKRPSRRRYTIFLHLACDVEPATAKSTNRLKHDKAGTEGEKPKAPAWRSATN